MFFSLTKHSSNYSDPQTTAIQIIEVLLYNKYFIFTAPPPPIVPRGAFYATTFKSYFTAFSTVYSIGFLNRLSYYISIQTSISDILYGPILFCSYFWQSNSNAFVAFKYYARFVG